MVTRYIAITVCSALFVLTLCSGCTKKLPPECKSTLTKAMDALKAKNQAGYLSHVIPEQRTKALPIVSKYRFFKELKGYTLELDSVTLEGDTAEVIVSTSYADAYVGNFRTFLVKKNGKWFIDFARSVAWQKKSGSDFGLVKLVK